MQSVKNSYRGEIGSCFGQIVGNLLVLATDEGLVGILMLLCDDEGLLTAKRALSFLF